MGFFFRKSIGFGPFRINLSKSGLGVSGGIRGARLSVGPRGTYVHGGRGGFYYKQKLRSTEADSTQVHHRILGDAVEEIISVDIPPGRVVDTIKPLPKHPAPLLVHVGYLILTALAITQIYLYALDDLPNSIEGRNTVGWLLFVIPPSIWFIGVCLHFLTKFITLRPRLYPLYYQLDQASTSRFSGISAAFEALSRSRAVWSISSALSHTMMTQGQVPVPLSRQQPPQIVTNVDPWSIAVSGWKMFFLPDNIYILNQGVYSALPYEALKISHSQRRAFEFHGHQSDATVVDQTWAHTRKDGLPDRRFKYNPMIPIVLYGLVKIDSNAGWSVVLQTSSLASAEQFFIKLSAAIPGIAGQNEQRRSQSSESKQRTDQKRSYRKGDQSTAKPRPESVKSAYEVLEVSQSASMEEITNAYRQKARMNHPDRVASLASEFRELAERRMKEINAAYEELRRRNS